MRILKLTRSHRISNVTHISTASKWQFVYSYDTPVIAINPQGAVMVTVVYHSKTTTKAIKTWLSDNGIDKSECDFVDQQVLNDLVKDI